MDDWQRIALGDAVITGLERGHYDTAVMYGHLAGGPFVASVDPESGVKVLEVVGSDPVSFAAVSEQIQLAIDGPPPLHLLENRHPDWPGGPQEAFMVCDDADTSDLVRLWPVCGDEDSYLVTLDQDGRLRVVDVACGEFPDDPGLWAAEDDPRSASLLVGQGAVSVYVAGLLRGDGQEPGHQLWVGDPDDGWIRADLEPAPDAFTDIYSGMYGAVAGHRGGLPLLFDDYGTPLETPEVPLQPDHPMVCVLKPGTPASSSRASATQVVLALQSAEAGPQLWTGGGGRPWTVEPLPRGRLTAARATGDGKYLWVVVDWQAWCSHR
ncbi:hypothetical protein [Nocardioides sp.]|uniref:hypothetical protein n=1 Tax=Nocardioides sp. TaxID=35761 RepID=UPI002CB2D05C|nr:hypothetical protein [Nocardioides sp.]HXH80745.1 hypothetical protein [Nocardioides sp.]